MKILLQFIVVLALAVPFHAQDSSKNSQETAKKDNMPRDVMVPDDAYKMTFAVYEIEEGKRTNQRDYVMIARTMGGESTLKIGTRVPVTVKEKETQYIDVGMDVRCLLREPSSGKLRAQLDITDVLGDRKSTRLNSSHANISYAVFCLKKKKK